MPSCRDVGHAYSIFLRMYTAACGFALMGIAVFVIVSSIELASTVESDDCTTGATVGPGSYTPARTNAGDMDIGRVSEGLRSAGLQSASMVSESAQRPLAADLW